MQNQESYFHDPIHGHIALTALERELVDTVEFQRLRFIRQLSLMHYVFPGSFHTRFAHSLGVCHTASRVAAQLFPGERNQFNYCLQVFRLASLLHDVGHGAFSHSLTRMPGFLPHLRQVLERPDAWGFDMLTSAKLLRALVKESALDRPIEHEVLSVLIVHRLFIEVAAGTPDLLQGIDVSCWQEDVSSLLAGGEFCSEVWREHAEALVRSADSIRDIDASFDLGRFPAQFMRTLSDLVAGTIDTDRMDYLLRDSQNCGVSYGLFDLDGLISSIHLICHKGEVYFGLKAKRANTLDDFLWSRYQMFRQIYCHKTHNAYNLLLEEAFADLVRLGEIETPVSLNHYLSLTDDHVMSKVFGVAQKKASDAPWVEAVARRRLPLFLGVYEAPVDDAVWHEQPREVFKLLDTGQYEGWESDDRFCHTSLKTEVIKGAESRLPWLIDEDKLTGRYVRKSLLAKSVFFNAELIESRRMAELKRRLNRRLMFFYRHRL